MSGKRGSWYGKSVPAAAPGRIALRSILPPDEAREFLAELKKRNLRDIFGYFRSLAVMRPFDRLRRNLKVTITELGEKPATAGFMQSGLTRLEQKALKRLALIESGEFNMQMTAQMLLNVEERYQLYRFIGGTLDSQRNVKWPPPTDWMQW